jgi:hypothetical protein
MGITTPKNCGFEDPIHLFLYTFLGLFLFSVKLDGVIYSCVFLEQARPFD